MIEKVNVSSDLEIEAVWTEEATPQLEQVEIVAVHGTGAIVAGIKKEDLPYAIAILNRILDDSRIQEAVKLRKGK